MSNARKTDFITLLPDLNGGVLEQQISNALSDIAANVVTHGKKGRLVLTIDLKQVGDSHQVTMTHALKSSIPTRRGKITEEIETDTALHVGTGGALSLFPAGPVLGQAQLDLAPRANAEKDA